MSAAHPSSGADPFEVLKWQWTWCLLGPDGLSDPWMATEIKKAIEFHLTGELADGAALAPYAEAATTLFTRWRNEHPRCGFQLLELGGQPYDPLFLRPTAIRSLKLLAGYERALLGVTGLREAVVYPHKTWTKGAQHRLGEALFLLEGLARQYSTPSTQITLACV